MRGFLRSVRGSLARDFRPGSGRRGSGKSSGSSGGGRGKSGTGGGKKGGGKGRRGGGRREFGGIIDEPIVGIGIHTGQEYSFGEGGREIVTPIGAGDEIGGDIIINIGNITKEADYMK